MSLRLRVARSVHVRLTYEYNFIRPAVMREQLCETSTPYVKLKKRVRVMMIDDMCAACCPGL